MPDVSSALAPVVVAEAVVVEACETEAVLEAETMAGDADALAADALVAPEHPVNTPAASAAHNMIDIPKRFIVALSLG